jgi:hypothetical protein
MNSHFGDDMLRTTVYLPRSTVERVRVAALARGVTSAAVIRATLEAAIGENRPPPVGGFLAGALRAGAEWGLERTAGEYGGGGLGAR